MFLPSKSDVNKLTNPYQIRIQQRCDRIENHFVHNSLVSFSNYVSIVKLHTFAIYSANDDFCFFMKKKTKNRVRFVGQKQIKVPHYTGISYNVKEWGPTLKMSAAQCPSKMLKDLKQQRFCRKV